MQENNMTKQKTICKHNKYFNRKNESIRNTWQLKQKRNLPEQHEKSNDKDETRNPKQTTPRRSTENGILIKGSLLRAPY